MGRRARATAAAAATVGLALAVLAGCEPTPYVGPAGGPRLALVGDSLLAAVQPAAQTRFAAEGWSDSVTGIAGFTLGDQHDTIERAVATHPQVLVVELGSNDLRLMAEGAQDFDGYRSQVQATIQATAGVPCLVWVGVETTNGTWGPGGDNRVEGPWLNLVTWLELARSGRPAGSVVWADWAAASQGQTAWFKAPGDTHHSTLGDAAYLTFLDASVARCPGGPTSSTSTSTSAPASTPT